MLQRPWKSAAPATCIAALMLVGCPAPGVPQDTRGAPEPPQERTTTDDRNELAAEATDSAADATDESRSDEMSEQYASILQNSVDPNELRRAAIGLARSADAADHALVVRYLGTPQLLTRLNTEEEYNGSRMELRLRRVLQGFSASSNRQSAHQALLSLTKSPAFLEAGSRIELLIEASAVIRPAPPELVRFWDQYSQPDDGFTPITIEAIVANDSPPALQLFERKVLDSSHDELDKTAWFRSSVLTHRQQANLLASCERLLGSAMSTTLKSELIDVLFDYKPQSWYTPAVTFSPPPVSAYGQDAREALGRIAILAAAMPTLSELQREAIRSQSGTLSFPVPEAL